MNSFGTKRNPLKLKPGDRITFLWSKEEDEFTTAGYVMKITENGIMCYFPSHKKAKKIRFWPWALLYGKLSDYSDRMQKDTIGTIKKLMKE